MNKRSVLSWAFYDWANSAFATTVIAGFFPIFFKDYWSKDSPVEQSTFWLGVAISSAGLIVAVLSPLLGSFSDLGSKKKVFLASFAGLGIVMTGGLYFLQAGDWQLAAIMYTLASVGFLCSNVFYDSLITTVSSSKTVDLVSSQGYGMGYIGGGILFLINVIMVQQPEWFGFSSPAEAVKWSFLSVALWWLLFSIPLFLFVKEPAPLVQLNSSEVLKFGLAEFRQSLKTIFSNKTVSLFLVAYWLYIDGVDTIIAMSVDFGKSIGIPNSDLITALLLVQFIGFPFAILFGWLGQKFGAKRTILICIAGYLAITILGSQLDNVPVVIGGVNVSKFYLLAIGVAIVQGGIQSLSRSLFARIVPPEKSGEYFGFYNMMGKFATIIGPVLMGTVTVLSGSPRIGILSISVLFIVGGYLLWKVKIEE